MNRVREILRSGDWLTRERIRMVASLVLIASALGILFLVVTAQGDVDRQGRPLGTDFSNVYAAGTFVREGRPEAPFQLDRQYAREQAIFGASTPFYGWHYPPYFLFVAGALATMPYALALAVWQAITFGLYLLVIRAIAKPDALASLAAGATSRRHLDWLLLAVAFPAVLINVGHGQNGFLTAALLGGALTMLDRRPLIAGVLFGLLVYKPQYGALIPIALAAGGYWRSFAAAAVTVVVLTLATTLAFGPQVWHAFLASTEFTRTVALEQGDTGWYKIQSVFSWARMWGAPIPVAYALQGALFVALVIALARLWRSAAPYALKAAALCLGAVLATPYTFDYDMMALGPAIAILVADGIKRGFAPWEKTALAALWLVPLVARNVAEATLIPLGVPAMLALLIVVLQRSELGAPMDFAGASPTMTGNRAGAAGASRNHDIAAFE